MAKGYRGRLREVTGKKDEEAEQESEPVSLVPREQVGLNVPHETEGNAIVNFAVN